MWVASHHLAPREIAEAQAKCGGMDWVVTEDGLGWAWIPNRLPVLAYVGDRREGHDVFWRYETEDGRTVEVKNPRLEPDGDEYGVWDEWVHDGIFRDGEEVTEGEADYWSDAVRDALRDTP